MVWAGTAYAQTTKTFTGKISEIARGTELDLDKHGTFYVVRLAEHPKISFRISQEDAVRFGVIDPTGTSGVLTPKKSTGLGWQVKLTCNGTNLGEIKTPVYKVVSLERLSD